MYQLARVRTAIERTEVLADAFGMAKKPEPEADQLERHTRSPAKPSGWVRSRHEAAAMEKPPRQQGPGQLAG